MKRFKTIAITLLVSLAVLFSSVAIAQGWGNKGRGPGYNQQRQGFPGPGRVLWEEMYTARVEVLAELSGLSQDEIQSKLAYKPVWAVLDETKVDVDTFRSKMHEKAKSVVTQAVADGKLTKDQGDYMLQRMENGPGYGMGPRGRGRGYGPGYGRGPCGQGRWN